MNASIICVGKLRERWQQEGCAEYLKRLTRYGKYEILQLDDLREPENASPAHRAAAASERNAKSHSLRLRFDGDILSIVPDFLSKRKLSAKKHAESLHNF